MNSNVYKWCAVPQCKNTSIKTPNKVFVHVPMKRKLRIKWLKLARRNPKEISPNSNIYFCEDHFDLPNDMENYMEHHVMGSVSQVRMKPGCMPKKFTCQPDRKTRTSDTTERPYLAKKRRRMILEECEKQIDRKTIVTQQSHSQEIASSSGMNNSNNSIDIKPPIRSLIKFEDELFEDEYTVKNTEETNSLAIEVTVIKEEYIEQADDDITNENYEFNNANNEGVTFEINKSIVKEIFVKEEYVIDVLAKEAETNKYVCQFCTRIFEDWKELLQHNLIHLNLQLEKCDCQYQRKKTRKTEIGNSQLCKPDPETGLWKCIVCSKSYDKYKKWYQHVTEVHTAYNYICNFCEKLYHTKEGLQNHIKFIHKKLKKKYLTKQEAPCTQCNAVLDSKHALKTHMRTVHSLKSFKCDICGLGYKCFPYLQTHKRRVHKETGQFICDVCSKCFKSRRRLLIHIKRPHLFLEKQRSIKKQNKRKKE